MSRFSKLSHVIWHCQYHICMGSKISLSNLNRRTIARTSGPRKPAGRIRGRDIRPISCPALMRREPMNADGLKGNRRTSIGMPLPQSPVHRTANITIDSVGWRRVTTAARPHDEHGEGRLMRFAYADPPYVGQAKRHYADDPKCAEVNHEMLITHLDEFDGWALSCSSPSLRMILPMCPEDIRVMPWCKPFCSFKPGVTVAYAWEPVIVRGGRKRERTDDTIQDFVLANITLRRGLTGVKPRRFCYWMFEVLNIQPHDEFVDLFPGSGAVSSAFDEWSKITRGEMCGDLFEGAA